MESIEYNFFVAVIIVCVAFTIYIIYNMFIQAYEMRNGLRRVREIDSNNHYIHNTQQSQQQPQAKKPNKIKALDNEIQKKEKELRDLLREKSKETQEGEIIV
jgi:SMC interacting uncharacterized protein involved in chromosome segregation